MIKLLLLLPVLLCAREWTAFVYMAADNDLSQWADSDLVELERVGSDDDLAIIVQLDKPTVGAKRLYVQNGSSTVLQDLGITDMCDWHTLSEFLEWGIRYYPAEKYCVILWDHGTGWTEAVRRSFGTDWSSGSRLSIADGDLRKAVATAHQYTGETIHVFAFDACVMQMAEVLRELYGYAEVCVAPQTVCPLPGFKYDSIFNTVKTQPGMGVRDLAANMVAVNVEYYTDVQAVAFSAVDIDDIVNLQQATDRFIDAVVLNDPGQYPFNSIRDEVQTLPVFGYPEPGDAYIDFGDFIRLSDAALGSSESQDLLNVYANAVIASGSWGPEYSNTTGLSVWCPYEYLHFKQLVDHYRQLLWAQSRWCAFLNWYYDSDDIRPSCTHSLQTSEVGQDNDFRLSWNGSFDLAPVTYDVIENVADSITDVFSNPCEDVNGWIVNGFTLDSFRVYSGSYSFFSGNGSDLMHWIETSTALDIEHLGILSMYLYYTTEDIDDSLIIQYGDITDVHYGSSQGWQVRRLLVPPGSHRLRISYHTDGATNLGGCYIDEITLQDLDRGRYVQRLYQDTVLHVYNKERGVYQYAVVASDRYGNAANLSDLVQCELERYAVPYSIPSPFQDACDIFLDFPDTVQPTVTIFSLSGRKLREFPPEDVTDRMIHWDGTDDAGRVVGAGVYFVVLHEGAFTRIGKVARQR
jgi:hypothetical protein